MLSIVLADDHEIVRRGVATLIGSEPDLRVVAEAADGVEALHCVQRFRPDILLADVRMPGLSGVEVAREVSRCCPATRVILVSGFARDVQVAEVLRNGASGFVSKSVSASEILVAIRAVAAGRLYVSAPVAGDGNGNGNGDGHHENAAEEKVDRFETLSARERQILHLVAEGHTNAAIGEKLFISTRTVETHRANVMRKLGLRSHGELLVYAMRRGIVGMD